MAGPTSTRYLKKLQRDIQSKYNKMCLTSFYIHSLDYSEYVLVVRVGKVPTGKTSSFPGPFPYPAPKRPWERGYG